MFSRRPSPATLIALLALFVALGGPAEAAKLINGRLIKKGTIRSAQVKDRSLTTRDLSTSARRALTATPASSVGAAQLLTASITADKLAVGAVSGPAIADESIAAVDIAPSGVGNSELAPNAVTGSKIGGGAVGKSEVATDAVGSSEVIDGELTARDVGSFAGTVNADFPALLKGECAGVDVAVTPVRAENLDVTDDVVVVTPPAAWPKDLTLTAVPTAATTVRLSACNVGDTAVAGVDLADLTFRYVSFA